MQVPIPLTTYLKDQVNTKIEAIYHVLLEPQNGIWTINLFRVIKSLRYHIREFVQAH